MFGVSYNGATQWLAAMGAPPHLVTIMPALSPSGVHDGWAYRGGAFELGFNLSLVLLFFALDAARKAVDAGNYKSRPNVSRRSLRQSTTSPPGFAGFRSENSRP